MTKKDKPFKTKTRVTPHPRRGRFKIPTYIAIPKYLTKVDLEGIEKIKADCPDLSWERCIAIRIENIVIDEEEECRKNKKKK